MDHVSGNIAGRFRSDEHHSAPAVLPRSAATPCTVAPGAACCRVLATLFAPSRYCAAIDNDRSAAAGQPLGDGQAMPPVEAVTSAVLPFNSMFIVYLFLDGESSSYSLGASGLGWLVVAGAQNRVLEGVVRGTKPTVNRVMPVCMSFVVSLTMSLVMSILHRDLEVSLVYQWLTGWIIAWPQAWLHWRHRRFGSP